MILNRKLFLDLDAVRRAAGFFIVKWIKWHRGLSIEEVHKWRRPIGVLSVARLLSCQKKSDLLRLLCCPGAVVALMDARLPVYLPKFHYDGEKYVRTAKTRSIARYLYGNGKHVWAAVKKTATTKSARDAAT